MRVDLRRLCRRPLGVEQRHGADKMRLHEPCLFALVLAMLHQSCQASYQVVLVLHRFVHVCVLHRCELARRRAVEKTSVVAVPVDHGDRALRFAVDDYDVDGSSHYEYQVKRERCRHPLGMVRNMLAQPTEDKQNGLVAKLVLLAARCWRRHGGFDLHDTHLDIGVSSGKNNFCP